MIPLEKLLPPPLPYLHPLPGTVPLTPQAAVLPPLLYYLAALLLPPLPSVNAILVFITRNTLALLAAILFIRLPLTYHVPFSIGLTYQLGLIGIYGSCRIIDLFFISRYLCNFTPRRVTYRHAPREKPTPGPPTGPDAESYFSLHFLTPGQGEAVTEHASSKAEHGGGWSTGWRDRLSWALELELSLRGAGFTWTSADVRHSKRTWRPTVPDRLHSILIHAIPVLLGSWALIRGIYVGWLIQEVPADATIQQANTFDTLPVVLQLSLTAALGAFLMAAFSIAHSGAAILAAMLLSQHPLSYFPPLYTLRVWEVTSVRQFWSYAWHRLFSRLFLVYGVWPGEIVARQLLKLTSIASEQDHAAMIDIGKVLGAFTCSGFVHSFAGHTVVPGGWRNAGGEATFFIENGVAVVVEEAVRRIAIAQRRRIKGQKQGDDGLSRWYDGTVGRVWWVTVLLYTGRNFARGWVLAGLVREMAQA